mgnify:CR=1 FL=1
MSRILTAAVAQMGPVSRDESRVQVVDRLIVMMRHAHARGAGLVVFPELALTTFFPRWVLDSQDEIDSFFETKMPSNDTQTLFDVSRELGIGFHLGYAEKLTGDDGILHYFNTAILVDQNGVISGKYRKIHLPGHAEPQPNQPHQHLEKRYFEVGDLGFPAFRSMDGIMGMCICNDRRWPETYRVLGLQGVEMIMLGYNTPTTNPFQETESPHLGMFHNHLSMQAGAYQNGAWVLAAAKAGTEEGVHHMGGSCIISPTGEMVVQALSEGDEVIVAECDLDRGKYIRETIFNFDAHRRIEHYGLITERTGAVLPPEI